MADFVVNHKDREILFGKPEPIAWYTQKHDLEKEDIVKDLEVTREFLAEIISKNPTYDLQPIAITPHYRLYSQEKKIQPSSLQR